MCCVARVVVLHGQLVDQDRTVLSGAAVDHGFREAGQDAVAAFPLCSSACICRADSLAKYEAVWHQNFECRQRPTGLAANAQQQRACHVATAPIAADLCGRRGVFRPGRCRRHPRRVRPRAAAGARAAHARRRLQPWLVATGYSSAAGSISSTSLLTALTACAASAAGALERPLWQRCTWP